MDVISNLPGGLNPANYMRFSKTIDKCMGTPGKCTELLIAVERAIMSFILDYRSGVQEWDDAIQSVVDSATNYVCAHGDYMEMFQVAALQDTLRTGPQTYDLHLLFPLSEMSTSLTSKEEQDLLAFFSEPSLVPAASPDEVVETPIPAPEEQGSWLTDLLESNSRTWPFALPEPADAHNATLSAPMESHPPQQSTPSPQRVPSLQTVPTPNLKTLFSDTRTPYIDPKSQTHRAPFWRGLPGTASSYETPGTTQISSPIDEPVSMVIDTPTRVTLPIGFDDVDMERGLSSADVSDADGQLKHGLVSRGVKASLDQVMDLATSDIEVVEEMAVEQMTLAVDGEELLSTTSIPAPMGPRTPPGPRPEFSLDMEYDSTPDASDNDDKENTSRPLTPRARHPSSHRTPFTPRTPLTHHRKAKRTPTSPRRHAKPHALLTPRRPLYQQPIRRSPPRHAKIETRLPGVGHEAVSRDQSLDAKVDHTHAIPREARYFVGGLSHDTTDASMKAFFATWGKVVDARVMWDAVSHRCKGFGFVTYGDPRDGDQLIGRAGLILDNKEIEVKTAESRHHAALAGTSNNNYPSTYSYASNGNKPVGTIIDNEYSRVSSSSERRLSLPNRHRDRDGMESSRGVRTDSTSRVNSNASGPRAASHPYASSGRGKAGSDNTMYRGLPGVSTRRASMPVSGAHRREKRWKVDSKWEGTLRDW